jgi:hypothetical protein
MNLGVKTFETFLHVGSFSNGLILTHVLLTQHKKHGVRLHLTLQNIIIVPQDRYCTRGGIV